MILRRAKAVSRAVIFIALIGLAFGLVLRQHRGVERVLFRNLDVGTMTFEVLDDASFRFEISPGNHKPSAVFEKTATISRQNFAGPTNFHKTKDGFETPSFSVTVRQTPFCFQVQDKLSHDELAEICPQIPGPNRLLVSAPQMTHVYGLGEEFTTPSDGSLNWIKRKREPGDAYGNHMVPFAGGFAGNAQFPIAYALGKGLVNFALLVDNVYAQTWDFTRQPWQIEMSGGASRGYFITGRDLQELRTRFMDLVGRPPVPPRKAFGLWVSEYGFDNWQEMDDKLRTLKAQHFPIDGLVMDLNWFGGVKPKSPDSAMGGLEWDQVHFPEPAKHLADFKARGIGIIGIEEPFIARGVLDLKTQASIFETLEQKGFLAMDQGHAVLLKDDGWWGVGGLFDYPQDAAADFWHDWKRQPLIETGFMGHWTDLGEPETYDAAAVYNQGEFHHPEIQNLYNFKWSESIFRGYLRHGVSQRPWILTRSGTVGTQRFGVGMWSGDLGSNFESLAAHFAAQAHLSLSGIDYLSSDVGGFHRKALRGDMNALYTSWLAASALFDVPVRPHTENLCNCKETAPDRIGDRASNLANLRRRYELNPYYYSVAHQAYQTAMPLIAPLVYYFQSDLAARDLGFEKMIGPSLLAAAAPTEGLKSVDVYLPKGEWYDFTTGELLKSEGQIYAGRELSQEGVFQLPLFARAGSLIPKAQLDADAKATDALLVDVFPSTSETEFTLYEDDGATSEYLRGQLRKTRLTQTSTPEKITLRVASAVGSYKDMITDRPLIVNVVSEKPVTSVSLNSEKISPAADEQAFRSSAQAWRQTGRRVEIKAGKLSTQGAKTFEILR